MNAKEKDRILAEIKAYKPHGEIDGLGKALPELELDGYVLVWRSEQHTLINIRLTKKGHQFISEGGYAAQNRLRIKAKMKKFVLWLFAILTAALIEESARVILIPILFHE